MYVQRLLRHMLSLMTASLLLTTLRGQSVQIENTLDTNAILIGDQIHMNIRVIQPKKLSVLWPFTTDTLSSHIETIGLTGPDTSLINDSTIAVQSVLTLTSFDSGTWVVPPLHFIYQPENDTAVRYALSKAFALKVDLIPVDTSQAPKNIKPIIKEPYLVRDALKIIIPVLVALLLFLLALYGYKRRKANKPLFGPAIKPLPPPEVEARAALDELKNKKLWQQGHHKTYYTTLIDIIRRYLERRYEFPAPEMISDEIIGCMKNHINNQKLIDDSRSFMEQADLVKFAKAEPLPDTNDAIMKWAYRLVDDTSAETERKEDEQ